MLRYIPLKELTPQIPLKWYSVQQWEYYVMTELVGIRTYISQSVNIV